MVAKIMAKSNLKIVLSIHPPGTGKSWIAALLVATYNQTAEGIKFIIITTDQFLVDQLRS